MLKGWLALGIIFAYGVLRAVAILALAVAMCVWIIGRL